MTPHSADRAHNISPLDLFGPAPHQAAAGAASAPAFAAVLNKAAQPIKASVHRQSAQQSQLAKPERATEPSLPASRPDAAGKKSLAKANRTNGTQQKTEDEERTDVHGLRETANVPRSDTPPATPPPADNPQAASDQPAVDVEGPPSIDPADEQALKGNSVTASPVAAIDEQLLEVPAPSEEVITPPAADEAAPTSADSNSKDAKNPGSIANPPGTTGEDMPPAGEYAAAVHGNGPLSLAELGQDSKGAADPIVAIDGQVTTQEVQPAEANSKNGEKSKDSGDDASTPQNASDVQAPALTSLDVPTSHDSQNTAAVPVTTNADAPSTPKDAPQGPSGSSQSTAGVQPPPSRLPQHVLTRAEGHRGHNLAPVPIDSARFLSRVAKAFTAAQQRDGEVRLRLSPPELGSLRLQVSVQDGVMVARMETETEAARASLTNNLPALRERLAEQGIRVERFDIDLMQHSSTGTPDRPLDPQQQQDPQPLRSLRTNQTKPDFPAPQPSASSWSGQGRLNVII